MNSEIKKLFDFSIHSSMRRFARRAQLEALTPPDPDRVVRSAVKVCGRNRFRRTGNRGGSGGSGGSGVVERCGGNSSVELALI